MSEKKDGAIPRPLDKIVTPSVFMDRLSDFLGDSEDMTAEEVKAELEAEGIDVDKMLKRARIVIKHMVKQASGAGMYADFRRKDDRDYFNSLSKEELVEICFHLSRDAARLRRELDHALGVVR